jgi:hypothetical protein
MDCAFRKDVHTYMLKKRSITKEQELWPRGRFKSFPSDKCLDLSPVFRVEHSLNLTRHQNHHQEYNISKAQLSE